jgi:hypothetical protein
MLDRGNGLLIELLPDRKDLEMTIHKKLALENRLCSTARLKMKCYSIIFLLLGLACFDTAQIAFAHGMADEWPELTERERLLLERIEQLERRMETLEKRMAESTDNSVSSETVQIAPAGAVETAKQEESNRTHVSAGDREVLNFFRDTTINFTIDGYYGYNFNRPIGHTNLLRAYDVISNSFSLNQAALILERAPNVEEGRRFGLRLDLQYGQATETVAGNPNNELRPQVYRNIFQAYGTYIFPLGNGLSVDFGKFSSSLGLEANYTKDQINYSRAYFFNFLPYYHLGFRSTYIVNDKLALTHWLVNGTQQGEDFNGFKSQAILINFKPAQRVSFNVNYYTGLEGRDSVPVLNPGFPPLPTQPGLPTESIRPVPRGRLHILDSYLTWNVTDKLTLAGEADYVINRAQTFSPPSRVTGGALYARYQFTPEFALAARAEYLSDRGGLFSGATQALKETTLTAEYRVAEGFLIRGEFRRDFSNQPFFLTSKPGLLKKEQNSATFGLVWWFGRKQGAW